MTPKISAAIACCVMLIGRISPPLPQTPPIPQAPVRLALVGQSNASLGRPAFSRNPDIAMVPITSGAPYIENWAADGPTWPSLVRDIRGVAMDAFVFWQGESDVKMSDYDVRLADFVRRVRAEVGNPNLLMVLVQYGPAYTGQAVNGKGSEAASIAFALKDPNALYVLTHDLEWLPDGGHMPDSSYAAVAERIVSMIRQRRSSAGPGLGELLSSAGGGNRTHKERSSGGF